MTRPRSLVALAAGCAVIVAVNAIILGAAAWNRSGERVAEMTLTERELALPEFREDESSSLALTLRLASQSPMSVQRIARSRREELPAVVYPWLDRAKLEALGFRLGSPLPDSPDEHGGHGGGERPAFIALEYDGDAWARWMASREERLRKRLPKEDADALIALDRTMRSRLVPVDAERDEATLRRRYPDRKRVLIVAGLVRSVVEDSDDEGGPWRGQIGGVLVPPIQVARELAPALANFLPQETESAVYARERKELRPSWPAPAPPRYRAVVAFGRGNEPWLVGVSELAGE